MSQSSKFLELAKQGDPKVIAGLLTRSLQDKGISVRAAQRNGELQLWFKCQTRPEQNALIPYLQKALTRLHVPPMPVVVYVCPIKTDEVVWQQRFSFQGTDSAVEFANSLTSQVAMVNHELTSRSPGLEPLAPETTNPELTPAESDLDGIFKRTADKGEDLSSRLENVPHASVTHSSEELIQTKAVLSNLDHSALNPLDSSKSTHSDPGPLDLDSINADKDHNRLDSKQLLETDLNNGQALDNALDNRLETNGAPFALDNPVASDTTFPESEVPSDLNQAHQEASDEPSSQSSIPLLPFVMAALLAIVFAVAGVIYRVFFSAEPTPILQTSESQPEPVSPAPARLPSQNVEISNPANGNATNPANGNFPEVSTSVEPGPGPDGSPEATQSQELQTNPNPNPPDTNPAEPPQLTEPPTSPTPWRDAVNNALRASTLAQTAQTQTEWAEVATYWENAIRLMQAVPEGDANYVTAQQKAQEYVPKLKYARRNAGLE